MKELVKISKGCVYSDRVTDGSGKKSDLSQLGLVHGWVTKCVYSRRCMCGLTRFSYLWRLCIVCILWASRIAPLCVQQSDCNTNAKCITSEYSIKPSRERERVCKYCTHVCERGCHKCLARHCVTFVSAHKSVRNQLSRGNSCSTRNPHTSPHVIVHPAALYIRRALCGTGTERV